MIEKESVYSSIIGLIVADAVGVPYEFHSRSQMKDNPATTMTGYGTYDQPEGTWSDDSSMTLATMDSLTNGINYDDMMKNTTNGSTKQNTHHMMKYLTMEQPHIELL